MLSQRRSIYPILFALAISGPAKLDGQTAAFLQKWENFDFARQASSLEQLQGLSLEELKYLRGLVFGRRGRVFQEPFIQDFLKSRPWYKPLRDYREPKLTAMETQNTATIGNFENKLREELATKPIAPELLRGLFLEDARKLRNEIFARHGKIFKDKWLKKYFAVSVGINPIRRSMKIGSMKSNEKTSRRFWPMKKPPPSLWGASPPDEPAIPRDGITKFCASQ